MYRCLQLAAYGKGLVAPNPLVGSVIVCEGKIIGEGYHHQYGGPHAEVNAINSVKDKSLLKHSTLYVNLEPCSHYGKTPPCSELIIQKYIPRVVIGMKDPFPEVSGRGIQMLKDAGIDVHVGVLEEESKELNKRFLLFHREKRPYIILKWAQSADGFIDKHRKPGDGQKPVKFSNEFTQILVHKLRAEEAAIMVGKRTEELDNPKLNVRYWSGKDPIIVRSDSTKTLPDLMRELYEKNIQSLIVEGGAKLLNSFISAHLWDEARIETAEIELKEGVPAPCLNFARYY